MSTDVVREGTVNRRSIRGIVAILLLGAVVVIPLAHAGFSFGEDGDAGNYRGAALNDDQTEAVECAIQRIRDIANDQNEPAYNRGILGRIADCLADMLKKGRICSEQGGTNSDASRWFAPGETQRMKCTWDEDAINIKPEYLSKDEPKISMLTSLLVHEGIHCIQWPDGSGLADDTDQMEWIAYSWGHYINQKLLNNADLTEEQREELENFDDIDRRQRDAYCARVPKESRDRASAEARQRRRSKADPNKHYQQSGTDSSRIRITDDLVLVDEIQTSLDLSYDVAVGQDTTGGDILIVAGMSDGAGAIVTYTDNTGDGIADADTEQLLPGESIEPFSLSYAVGDGVGNLLFVFDLATKVVLVAPTDLDGRPTGLLPQPFATPDLFPELIETASIRSGGLSLSGGVTVLASKLNGQSDLPTTETVLHSLRDVTQDLQADFIEPVPWAQNVVDYRPDLFGVVQDGDTIAMVAGQAGHQIGLYTTDENATFLGDLLGQTIVPPELQATTLFLELNRPLVEGEYVVVHDLTSGLREPAGTLVRPAPTPEIFDTDRASYLSGETIQVFGRNFSPEANVTLSGVPVPSEFLAPDLLLVPVPLIYLDPAPIYVLEVEVNGLVSNLAGVVIEPDCNGNATADRIDIEDGFSLDENENGIPDECEPPLVPGDLNCDGVVDFADINPFVLALSGQDAYLALYPDCNWLNADANGDGLVDFEDINAFVAILSS